MIYSYKSRPPFMGGLEKIIREVRCWPLYFIKGIYIKSRPPFMGGLEKIIREVRCWPLYFIKG